jgi:hypothetical protein
VITVRRAVASGVLLICGAIQAMEETKKRDWSVVPQLCGRLQRVEGERGGNTKEKSLKKASVRVYKRTTGVSYQFADFVAERITGWGGAFRFPHLEEGDYWIVAAYQNKEYKMPLTIKKSDYENACATQLFWIRLSTGELEVAHLVQLD